jgi:hypothetical protein
MFAASTYEEIVSIERNIENQEVVVFLFVKPNDQAALDIIKEFEYIHYNSGKYCSIYAIGYTNDFTKKNDRNYRKISSVLDSDWYFSNKAFVEFKNALESRIGWKYSGETEVLVLQNNPGKIDPLNFQNYIAIDINKGIREGYIDSFQLFMETLVRSSKSKVCVKTITRDLRKSRISIKDIVKDTINDSKKIPLPVKKIVSDRLFYRCANYYQR